MAAPVCVICLSRFGGDDTCECSMEVTAEQAVEQPERASALLAWWSDAAGLPLEAALAKWQES